MKTPRQLIAVVTGTTAICSMQLFGVLISPQTHSSKPSIDLGILTAALVNLPANAQSQPPDVPQAGKNFTIAQANGSPIRFVPPATRSPRQSQGAGSRGCEGSLPVDLVTLLIPAKDYIGQTTSGHPTFFWYLSQPVSVPIQFTLVEPGVSEPVFKTQIDSPQPGMIKLQVPKDRPDLVTGRIYKWSVSVLCKERRPSDNVYLQSWIERVPITQALSQQLNSATSTSNSPTKTLRDLRFAAALRYRASIYARSGLWYDALADLSTAQTLNPNEQSLKEDFLSLLDQVGLTEVALQERQRLAKR